MRLRSPFAYVVEVDGARVVLNLHETFRGQVAGHSEGVSSISQPGDLFGVKGGPRTLVLRLDSLMFDEPREAQKQGVGTDSPRREPLRRVVASVVGSIRVQGDELDFSSDAIHMPALGAEALPLTEREENAVLRPLGSGRLLTLGQDARMGASVQAPLGKVLGRHVAVVGASGHGKSCYVAWLLTQLRRTVEHPRIVVFDVNGEYGTAFSGAGTRATILGESGVKIPYYALGRQGLGRLLLPSEKTQRPALSFALEMLPFVEADEHGARLVGDKQPVLFDDCRQGDASSALKAVQTLRQGNAKLAATWPHMKALAALVAEGYAIKTDSKSGVTRDAFNYGHIAPLVNRVNRLIEDPQFKAVVSVEGKAPQGTGGLSWKAEGNALVADLFGKPSREEWTIHVIDLSKLSHDLMPFVLGSLLELLAATLFERGPGGTYPFLLVLEEAHHYLRQLPSDPDTGMHSLAYERLAKEGRKFGLSLLLSTQRPSEISPTVLAQCGTWAVFRLTNDSDLKAVSVASEWSSRRLVDQIPGLPRRQAVVFGAGVSVPVRISVPIVSPTPKSGDPDFETAWTAK